MNYIQTKISGVITIEPKVFGDDRGYFFESFNKQSFEENIGKIDFVQDNESKSVRGVLRGLHFQAPPFAQSKLVRCVFGEVLDVAVDIRKNSPTYGEHVAVLLSEKNKRQLFIPRGFAHGFVVLSESAVFQYKVDNVYSPEHDGGILWNDSALNIDWMIKDSDVLLSAKDKVQPLLSQLTNPFEFNK